MITFGRKLKHLRQKNHLTQKELGIALGFSEDSADVRIAQYEADARKPRDEILVKMAKILCVPIDILTVDKYFYPAENIVKSIARLTASRWTEDCIHLSCLHLGVNTSENLLLFIIRIRQVIQFQNSHTDTSSLNSFLIEFLVALDA